MWKETGSLGEKDLTLSGQNNLFFEGINNGILYFFAFFIWFTDTKRFVKLLVITVWREKISVLSLEPFQLRGDVIVI